MLCGSLKALFRPPWPGGVFIYAPSYSHQQTALDDVREAASAYEGSLHQVEAHPSLLSSNVALDLRQLFLEASHVQSSESSPGQLSIASSSIFPANTDAKRHRLIIVPKAHLLRASHHPLIWSQLMNPPNGYTVALISSLTLDRWRTIEGLEDVCGHRPVVSLYTSSAKPTKQRVSSSTLLAALPSASELVSRWHIIEDVAEGLAAKHRSLYVNWAAAAFDSDLGDWDTAEALFLLVPIWVAACRIVSVQLKAPVDSRKLFSELGHGPALFAILSPLLRSALHDLHTRRRGTKTWIERQVAVFESSQIDGPTPGSTPGSKRVLSPLAALLLLAAFLASHLPSKSDAQFFLRDEAVIPNFSSRKKRRRRHTRQGAAANLQEGDARTANSNPLVLGPKPFALMRLQAIFQNLALEFGLFRAATSSCGSEWQRRQRHGLAKSLNSSRIKRWHLHTSEERRIEAQAAAEYLSHSLSVHRTLHELIRKKMLVVIMPSSPGIIVPQIAGEARAGDPRDSGSATAVLDSIPSRFEWLNHVSLRCNCLRHELRELILGEEDVAEDVDYEGQGSRPEFLYSMADDRVDDVGEDVDDDEDGLNLPRRARQGGLESYFASGSSGVSTRVKRKDWWTRLEEVGL